MADADGKDKKGCCQKVGDGFGNFAKFLYNSETGQVMGRSGKSWAKIGFFYLIFYGFLAGFFSGMLAVFLTTLNDPETGRPKLTQYLENQPGLSRLDQANGSVLRFNYNQTKGSTDVELYGNMVTDFLEKYNRSASPVCAVKEGGMEAKQNCKFDTKLLGNCSEKGSTTYGLTAGMPCFFIKINKVYDWVPKSNDGKGFLVLKCTDKNNKGPVEVFPAGFQISAFPFRGQKDFELPVVAVQFDITKVKAVDCYLQGKGITVSESYAPHRAYGNIRIKDIKK